jgi:hypothetical protein
MFVNIFIFLLFMREKKSKLNFIFLLDNFQEKNIF